MTKWVYAFGGGTAEGDAAMAELLGGKGANLAEMASLGLPVPPGFTLTTQVCAFFFGHGQTFPEDLRPAVETALGKIEDSIGAGFGDAKNPLLVSVRSGGRASMPGMMDTVLNLGLNEETLAGLAAAGGDQRFAWDSYRRFIQMYGGVVLGLDHDRFEELLAFAKEDAGYGFDTDMTAEDWRELVGEYKDLVAAELGSPFPDDPLEQLWGALGAVFKSWMNPRAITYRAIHAIPEDWGTAVNVQAMVFGNMGDDCATGVAFTRDPATGENTLYGEFLVNAQGEDVVAGIRTPQPLSLAARQANGGAKPALEECLPEVYAELGGVCETLERHYRDMQDIEFTVQKGRLWMLQTRTGKRTAAAAIRIAVEMVGEGLIDEKIAVSRVAPQSLDQLLHPTIAPDAERKVLVTGLPASPGAASGGIVFSADDAEARAARGENVILVRVETSPDDIHGMHAARGIVTARGGMTSHAAVVARGMGRACVAGAGALDIDAAAGTMSVAGVTLNTGDVITIDGATGEVMAGALAMVSPELTAEFSTLMGWADKFRRLGVRANAETPADVKAAAAVSLNKLAALTASEIVISDASGFMVSAAVATYPSLAELIYVKGVTSAIQTQIDTKLANVVEDTTPQLGGMLDVNTFSLGDGTRKILDFVEDGSAVNWFEMENQATGGGPILRSAGETNVDLNIASKGTGDVSITPASTGDLILDGSKWPQGLGTN
ncbi:MAG: pyruvate, phosphate dikinase, partial [Proteobacteria bacterium]|nr:pyruvate, phosphate dikinase [Pseudomonadota bacterium]